MPKVTKPVTETENSVLRPVVMDIARQIMQMTEISPYTEIYFPSNLQRLPQYGSTLTPKDEQNVNPNEQRVWIEVSEDYREDFIGSTAVHCPEHRFILADDVLGVYIKPVYVTSSVEIAFKFRATDEVTANRWRDNIRVQSSLLVDQYLHSATYCFHIPRPLLTIVQEIHRLREETDGYGDTYEEYFQACVTPRVTLLSNQTGKQTAWAISETLRGIVGRFDFTGQPEKGEMEEGGPCWTIGFTYKFDYEKPVRCQMTYPMMVHNQMIQYIPDGPDTDVQHLNGASMSKMYANWFESQNQTDGRTQLPGIALPDFDEFIPSYIIPKTQRVVTALVVIDPENPLDALDLNQLGDFEFKPSVMTFLKSEAQYVTKVGASLFDLSLYRNLDLLEAGSLRMNSDGNVTFTNPQSLREYYHVRLSLHRDWRSIDPGALVRARKHAEALLEIIRALWPWYEEYYGLPEMLTDDYISRSEIDKLIDRVGRGEKNPMHEQDLRMRTVGTLFIIAHRDGYAITQ